MLNSAVARALSFVPIAVATLLTSRVVIDRFGVDAFGAYTLSLSLIFLLPLNSLGVGTAITSSYASESPTSDHSLRTTFTAARVLAVTATVTVVGSLLLGLTDSWSPLLGAASGPSLWVGVGVAVYALSFIPGLGTSMLLGVHRNHVTVLVQTLFAPLILLGVVVVVLAGGSAAALVVVPAGAMVVVSLVTAVMAQRATGVRWRAVLAAVPFRHRHPGARIRQFAGPVLLTSIATPIALQSDRIVLSHVSSEAAVAEYTVMLQIIAPALALIGAASAPLFPIFTGARARGERTVTIERTLLLFCSAALALGALLAAVANPIADLISDDQVRLGVLLPVAGALFVVISAAAFPLSANLMDPSGVRFTATVTLVALPLNIALSIALADPLGPSGPLLATVIVGLVVQVVPGAVYSRRRQRAAIETTR